ncbi:MAG TPA: thioesterase family protein [Solirubrobacteraceae bacterium]|nr:thioesterase family protein [Solirubrobacteraceae bacterium]
MIFDRDGDLYVPTGHARGPWDPNALHGGAPAALIVREVERLAPEMRVARLTLEILGPVPMAPLAVRAEIVKPGRRFQVAEAEIVVGERAACRARVMLLRRGELPDVPQGDPPAPLPHRPADAERAEMLRGESFVTTGTDIRFLHGTFAENGPAAGWLKLDQPLVHGEEPSGAQRAAAAADFGNGLSRVVAWDDFLFVNTDLTVHLHRDPEGEWVGLDARTTLQPDGSGLAVSTLHDERGPVGVSLQTLYVDRRTA